MNTTDDFYKTLLDNLYDGVYFVDKDRKITYWNKGAERITGYAAIEVVGRHCSDSILMHIDDKGKVLCTGCCPLTEAMTAGELRSTDVYLLHKGGHRVPITVRVAPIRDAEENIIGGVEIFNDNTSGIATLERLAEFEKLAYVDPLTGLPNRRYTEITLTARSEEMQRYGWPFGVIFIDIDRFKQINDQYGHDVGDEALAMVARTLSKAVRFFDIVGRWGGEEFLAVIANVERDELIATANRFRALVEQSLHPTQTALRVTVSIGVARARPEETVAELLKRADGLMYESKAAGRNRVTADS